MSSHEATRSCSTWHIAPSGRFALVGEGGGKSRQQAIFSKELLDLSPFVACCGPRGSAGWRAVAPVRSGAVLSALRPIAFDHDPGNASQLKS